MKDSNIKDRKKTSTKLHLADEETFNFLNEDDVDRIYPPFDRSGNSRSAEAKRRYERIMEKRSLKRLLDDDYDLMD